jgi:hypothetical protein
MELSGLSPARRVPYSAPQECLSPVASAPPGLLVHGVAPGDYVQVIRTTAAAPNPRTMRACSAEVQAVLDHPR